MMFLYPVQLSTSGLSRFQLLWSPEYFLCAGAVLGDGFTHFASVVTTFCNTHVKKHSNLHSFRQCCIFFANAASILYPSKRFGHAGVPRKLFTETFQSCACTRNESKKAPNEKVVFHENLGSRSKT